MQFKPIIFYSSALNRRSVCYVGLPDDYDSNAEKKYPVIYLLHGKNGMETDWLYKGNAQSTIEKMIEDQKLRDVIVVMPNDGGYTEGTFYTDWYDGSGNFEQYIVDDLLPAIDGQFRTYRDRLHRVIGGLSMGGFGAVMLSLKNPDLFGAAVSFSGAVGDVTNLTGAERGLFAPSFFSRVLGPVQGEHAKKYNIRLLACKRIDENNGPALYLSCGKDDYLYEANIGFNDYLNEIGYNHQYEEFEGAHNWDYWTAHLPRGLAFFESYFGKQEFNMEK